MRHEATAMRAFIASDYEPITIKVREVLLREGWDCPATHVLTLELAAEQLPNARPELVVAVLRADAERSLQLLRQIRTGTPGRLLALGPAESKLILRALREGADLYLDDADIEGELLTAFARFPPAAGSQAEPGRLIGLLSP